MKRALIVNGFVTDVVAIGAEFETYLSDEIYWVDCPDDALDAGYEYLDGNFTIPNADTIAARTVARKVAYGSLEEQLGMQYDDAINGTTLWQEHIAQVKASTLRPSDLA